MWELIDEQLGQYLGLEKGEALKKYSELITLGRLQQPGDAAAFVSYLASKDSDYMTGQSVLIRRRDIVLVRGRNHRVMPPVGATLARAARAS